MTDSEYHQLIASKDIQGLLNKGYIFFNIQIRSDGIEVIDMTSGHATFSPGFSATLTNKVTGEVYKDNSCGCRVQIDMDAGEVPTLGQRYKFTGGGFMDRCGIIMSSEGKYEVTEIDPFIKLITNPEQCTQLSCADLSFVFFFLVLMYMCIWVMKPVN